MSDPFLSLTCMVCLMRRTRAEYVLHPDCCVPLDVNASVSEVNENSRYMDSAVFNWDSMHQVRGRNDKDRRLTTSTLSDVVMLQQHAAGFFNG